MDMDRASAKITLAKRHQKGLSQFVEGEQYLVATIMAVATL
jgi:hypothetical protein